MRVPVTIYIEVDVQAYRREYGEPDATPVDAREYVRDLATDAVRRELSRFSYVDVQSIERR